MRLLLILSICYLSITSIACAQNAEPAQAQVKYHFIHVRDTTERQRPYTENLLLLLGRNASGYTSIDARLQWDRQAAELAEQVKNAPDPNHVDLVFSGMKQTSTEEYYQFPATRKLFVKYRLGNYYLVEQPLPTMNWKITSDTLSINGLHCQKATTHFKGRDYTAWFCADLPFHNGPWKLNGLPGLIIQAQDSKKEVVFEFAGFDDVSMQHLLVELPTNVIRATDKEYDRLKELSKTDPQAFHKIPQTTKTTSAMDDFDVNRIKSLTIKTSDISVSRKINNPIELPEAKK